MDIKVSVIVPIYNVEKWLDECLRNIQNQTLSEIECICVDDGSTDDSSVIAMRYSDADKRFKYVRRDNGGQSRARNDGVNIAKGKYIYFCDSDDYILPNALETLYSISEQKRLDILFFGAKTIYENDKLKNEYANYDLIYFRKCTYENVYSGQELFIRLNQNDDYVVQPCLQFIKREHLERNHIDFYPGIIYEDNLFTFKNILQARRVSCISESLYVRRVRENSTMTATTVEFFHFISSCKCYLEMLKESYKYEGSEIKVAIAKCLKSMYNSTETKYRWRTRRYISTKEYEQFCELFDSVDKMLIKCMGFELRWMYLFPYKIIAPESRVVIYGAGNVGQSYIHQVEYSKYCEIVLWSDRNYKLLSSKYNVSITAPSEILQAEYDSILIAIEDEMVAERIKSDLAKLGVPINKVLWIKPQIMNV